MGDSEVRKIETEIVDNSETHRCPDCKQTLSVDLFYRRTDIKKGKYSTYCIECAKERAKKYYRQDTKTAHARARQWVKDNPERAKMHSAKARYGITEEKFWELISRPCEICNSTEGICIDHDHKTGQVRGALCRNCNHGLGNFLDDPILLQAAIDYLAK